VGEATVAGQVEVEGGVGDEVNLLGGFLVRRAVLDLALEHHRPRQRDFFFYHL